MKLQRTKSVLLCGMLAAGLVLALCGCGGSKPPEPAGTVAVVNPISQSDLDQMAREIGVQLTLPEEEFAQLSVRRFALDPVMFEVEFLWNGDTYTFRAQKGTEERDISGMYCEWPHSLVEDGCERYWNDEGQGICLWQESDLTFCISMSEHAVPEALEQLYLRLADCRG